MLKIFSILSQMRFMLRAFIVYRNIPSCVFMCARRLQARANFLLHSSHECGLSPTYI